MGEYNLILFRLVNHLFLKPLSKLSPNYHQSLTINTKQLPILIIPRQDNYLILMRLFQILIKNNINLSFLSNSRLLKFKEFNLSILKPKSMDIIFVIIAISGNFSFFAQKNLLILINLHYNFL